MIKEVWMIILLYLLGVNILGFLFMGIDKWKARKRVWRIPETTLFLIAILGGSPGSIVGMYVFRHKTKHWYFVYCMPVILIIQVIFLVLIFKGPLQIIAF